MKTYLNSIILLVLSVCVTQSGFSQNTEFYKDCKILSIDTNSIFPDYYIIKSMTDIGIIIMISYNDKNKETSESRKIRIDNYYDFELMKLDSIPIFKPDTMYYWEFPDVRGGNGKSILMVDDQIILEYEDFNYQPFKPLNLSGLYYKEIKIKD